MTKPTIRTECAIYDLDENGGWSLKQRKQILLEGRIVKTENFPLGALIRINSLNPNNFFISYQNMETGKILISPVSAVFPRLAGKLSQPSVYGGVSKDTHDMLREIQVTLQEPVCDIRDLDSFFDL